MIASPQKAAADEFQMIKQALTDRKAVPDPLGWVLPRVDDKASISEPTTEQLTPPKVMEVSTDV